MTAMRAVLLAGRVIQAVRKAAAAVPAVTTAAAASPRKLSLVLSLRMMTDMLTEPSRHMQECSSSSCCCRFHGGEVQQHTAAVYRSTGQAVVNQPYIQCGII